MSRSTLERGPERWLLSRGGLDVVESALVQLVRECVESASDDLKNGMASNPTSSSRDVAHRFSFCPSLFLAVLVRSVLRK